MLRVWVPSGILLVATVFSVLLLSSITVSAESSVDNLRVNVPISCTMSSTGNNSHNATINPGTYQTNVGETNVKIVCNDSEGFAVYAIGYTNDTYGDNTLTSTNSSTITTIPTGTATSGDSQWAMKLTAQTNPTPTYPIAIQDGFDSFHTVPDTYTLVARRNSGTDTGPTARGSVFTTTYQIYVNAAQAANNYEGKVKYALVHSASAPTPLQDNQFAIDFKSNGLAFEGGWSMGQIARRCIWTRNQAMS